MEREWHKIIAFNGSQERAFEELVCQIAMEEEFQGFKLFERIGTPDGGIECYWQLNDDSEWGWQAKYYENLRSTEWNSIKESLYTAIETHPKITKYHICVPHNLADARNGKKSQKDTWEKYKNQWTHEIRTKGINIDLTLWNSSTLFSKLSNKKLSGTRAYFFNEIAINEAQLKINLENSILTLGPKYSSALNLKIQHIVKPFDALARNIIFKEDFKGKLNEIAIELNDVISDCITNTELIHFGPILSSLCNALIAQFYKIDFSPEQAVPVQQLALNISSIKNELQTVLKVYRQIEENHKKKEQKENNKENIYLKNGHRNEFYINKVQKLRDEAEDFTEYLNSSILKIANNGVLILRGDWGTGKSHLLADIAISRGKYGIPSIFLLGMDFPEIPPRNFIQQTICPKYNLEEYLSALNSFAKTKGERLFFIIDAINEGKAKTIWRDCINAIINEFQNYKWIGLIISYRTTYETLLLPQGFKHSIITHTGFNGMEDLAIRSFFSYYKIRQTTPLLSPDFSTPLFLKIFCLTLQNKGLDTIEEGFEGISKIFESFIDSINTKIGMRFRYPYDKVNLVQKAIDVLIGYQLENNVYVIPYEIAHSIVEKTTYVYTNERNFIEELLRENLLNEDYCFDNRQGKNGISFSYERMIDHFKAEYLLSGIDFAALNTAFKENGPLYSYFFTNHRFCNLHDGLLKSLAILIPEKFGIELYEIINVKQEEYSYSFIFKSTLESIIWRKSDTTNKKLWNYLKNHLNHFEELENELDFYNCILHVCVNKGNYFNANFLHEFLIKKSISERDFIWSIRIDKLFRWYDNSAVTRIIKWCWNHDVNEYNINDETTLSLGKVLAWFFTNPNRFIRDQATKAFVCLFSSRIYLLKFILEEFKNVNDPYVLERILAGTYGAVSKSTNKKQTAEIAQYIYDKYFRHKKPPINVLIREYCKLIIKSAIGKGAILEYDDNNLYPPFKYSFPTDIPDKKWVDNLDKKGGKGTSTIIDSTTGFGDFSRYIIGTNSNSCSFSFYPTTSRIAYDKIKLQLRGGRKEAFEAYLKTVEIQNENRRLKSIGNVDQNVFDKSMKQLKKAQTFFITFLQSNLSANQLKLFNSAMIYIEHGLFYNKFYDMPRFDLGIIGRYILKRVFELGWESELFEEYDSNLNYHGRGATKPERIGKKYQWIGYYEIYALLTDNYDYYSRSYHDNDEHIQKYNGTWNEHLRDIDPTTVFLTMPPNEYVESESNNENWWFRIKYDNWNEERKIWLTKFTDLPDLRKLLVVKDPNSDEEWYNLNTSLLWKEEKKIGKQYYKDGHRELWGGLYGILVNKEDKSFVLKSGKSKIHWIRDDMPTIESFNHIYNGELYNSDVFTEEDPYSYLRINGKTIKGVITIQEYRAEYEYDCSQQKYSILRPCKYLFDLLDAEFGQNESCIYDKSGRIIAYDTSNYYSSNQQSFLINKKILDNRLRENNLELIWYFYGEKQDLGPAYAFRMLFSGFAGYVKEHLMVYPYFVEEVP